jgi:hypothetical protein
MRRSWYYSIVQTFSIINIRTFFFSYEHILLKPRCIQSSRVIVPAGTSKSTSRRHGIQAVTRVMAYVADAVTQWRCDVVFNNVYWRLWTWSALTSSALKWQHRIQCGFKMKLKTSVVWLLHNTNWLLTLHNTNGRHHRAYSDFYFREKKTAFRRPIVAEGADFADFADFADLAEWSAGGELAICSFFIQPCSGKCFFGIFSQKTSVLKMSMHFFVSEA